MITLTRHRSQFERHPIAHGAAAGIGVGWAGLESGARVAGRYFYSGEAPAKGRLVKAARRLFPRTRELGFKKAPKLGPYIGGGFASRITSRAIDTALPGRRIGLSVRMNPLHDSAELAKSQPFIAMTPSTNRKMLAHELGHASYHLGGGRKLEAVKGVASLAGGLGARFGLVAALGAQPLISRSHMSERAKHRARIASGVIPAAMSVPLLADEAMAWRRGAQIMRAAGATAEAMRNYHLANLGNLSAQTAAAAVAPVAAYVAARGYARRRKPLTQRAMVSY